MRGLCVGLYWHVFALWFASLKAFCCCWASCQLVGVCEAFRSHDQQCPGSIDAKCLAKVLRVLNSVMLKDFMWVWQTAVFHYRSEVSQMMRLRNCFRPLSIVALNIRIRTCMFALHPGLRLRCDSNCFLSTFCSSNIRSYGMAKIKLQVAGVRKGLAD